MRLIDGDKLLEWLKNMGPYLCISDVMDGIKSVRFEVESNQGEAVALWECPDCGFAFDSIHTDGEEGLYSCPCCAEIELTGQLSDAHGESARLREALERILFFVEKEFDAKYRSINALDLIYKIVVQALSSHKEEDYTGPSKSSMGLMLKDNPELLTGGKE